MKIFIEKLSKTFLLYFGGLQLNKYSFWLELISDKILLNLENKGTDNA